MKIILGILFVLFFIHCKKKVEPPEPTATLYVNDTFKCYWYFPEGSWWVYKRMDTTAEVYDTAVVTLNMCEMIFDRFQPYEWEYCAVKIEHSYFHPKTGDKSRKLSQLIDNTDGLIDRISSSSNGNGFSYTYFFSWPIDSASITDKSRGGGGVSLLIDTNDIYLPIGKIGNVVHIYMTYHDVWIAKDIGFIKYIHRKSENVSSTWELIDYHINP